MINAKPIITGEDDSGVMLNSLFFWPAERVHEVFARMEAAKGTDRESAELRIFAERMAYLYKNQCGEDTFWPDTDDLIHLAAIGEAVEDAARTASMEAAK
jgi:hypothetical protein